MSRLPILLAAITLTLLIVAGCSERDPSAVISGTGSIDAGLQGPGTPNGPHYNLNIIGVSKDKTSDMDGNNGHRIFVKLFGNTKIWLGEGDEFRVLDANGTDGNGAKFLLPDPDPDNDLVTRYSVYARALGKPNGEADMTTCFVDVDGNLYCSADTLTLVRSKGRQRFTNVSKELLSVYVDIDGDGVPERVGLFDDKTAEYFWSYDNRGLKLAQLRFYPIATDLN